MSGHKGGCCLLLLEDEPMILMDLELAAEDCGCAVLCATTAAGALELLRGHDNICCAVLDVNLGGGETCLPVARELDRRKVAYILHSGDLNRQNELVRQLGAVLVPKPASAQRVIEVAIEAAGGDYVHRMTGERLFSRAVLRLSPDGDGEDVAAFLQSLLTNDITGELPAYAALLTPQGKTLFDLIVWPAGEGALLLDCEADTADELIKRLSLYRLRRKIAIEREDTLGVYWQAELGDGGAPDPRLADLGQRWIAKVSDDDESADAAWTRHRLSLGVPEGRAELGDVLWLETNAAELNGVSFSKGCYVGQENTARMNWRQKVNRRLLVVPLDKSDETRRKAAHPELGLAVDHLRVDAAEAAALPEWLARSLPESER